LEDQGIDERIILKCIIISKEFQGDDYGIFEGSIVTLACIKSKAVPLHAMETLGGRGGIAPTHSRH
jgi:hypothetical protein